jgi:hypothetical protein
MVKKAKKPKAKQAAICVLDEPGWRPLPEAYKLLLSKSDLSTGFDLLEALKSGRLRCVRRPANSSQCKPVPRSFWRYRQFDATWIHSGDLDICGPDAVPGPGRLRNPQTDFDGKEFYVGQPEEVWPALAPPQATKENDAEEGEQLGRKPGPKTEWQYFVAGKFCSLKHAGKPPTVGDLAQLCQDQFNYPVPVDERAIRRLLQGLRRLLGD